MRRPETITRAFLDADGFFASCFQQIYPALRGRPVGVIPFETETDFTVIIACSREAKTRGVKNIMGVREAKRICPDIILIPQQPDLFRRAHDAMCSSIESVIPVEARKSIDELSLMLDKNDILDPMGLSSKLKAALKDDLGQHITVSIGFAPNRHLAKIACKMDKPNGTTIWHPEQIPDVLNDLTFEDIPGIGGRMSVRLWNAGIYTVKSLLATEPKHMRRLWRNVTGERLWYALHGYDVKAQPSSRDMFGHGRVLSPDLRSRRDAFYCSRILTVKAARRMRRAGYFASSLTLWMNYRPAPRTDKSWARSCKLYAANDDQAVMGALYNIWRAARSVLQSHYKVVRIGVYFGGLMHSSQRQMDLFQSVTPERKRWEDITSVMDELNARAGKSVITLGPWDQKYGRHVGSKIAFTRIPSAEDAF